MLFGVSSPLLYYKHMLLCSVYGILNVVVYFDRTKLINHDSSMKLFVEVEDKLFRDKVSCDWSRDGQVITYSPLIGPPGLLHLGHRQRRRELHGPRHQREDRLADRESGELDLHQPAPQQVLAARLQDGHQGAGEHEHAQTYL